MHIKYLYIDDDMPKDISRLVEAIESASNGTLEIKHNQVDDMSAIRKLFTEGGFDGLIVDQKLETPNEKGMTVDYFGSSLAQNFRTDMAARSLTPSPIILLSNEENFVKYYDPDESSYDLFDLAIKKNDITHSDKTIKHATMLSSLVVAYSKANDISKNPIDVVPGDIMKLLDLPVDSLFVDPRFIDYIRSAFFDPHAIVKRIYNSLVKSMGMLVDERTLATRLGVSIASSPEWPDLIRILEPCAYHSLFCNLKPRYWFALVEDWWRQIEPALSLKGLGANERVEKIKLYTGLTALNAIQPSYTDGNQSEKYWVNCIISGRPLDPFDALRAAVPDIKPWEQPKYLDITVVLNREHQSKGHFVHSEDQHKVNILKARLKPHVN